VSKSPLHHNPAAKPTPSQSAPAFRGASPPQKFPPIFHPNENESQAMLFKYKEIVAISHHYSDCA